MADRKVIRDGLQNLVANLGTARDKAAGSHYAAPCLTDQELLDGYRGAWLPRKIVDIPALDACRNWRAWQAESDQISKLEAEEKRLGVKIKVLQALTKARLFGGAAIYIGTGETDPSKPLRSESIGLGGVKHLTVMTRRQLAAGELEQDPLSDQYNKPKYYEVTSPTKLVRIHPSRLCVFVGSEHPEPELAGGTQYGWGDSILTAIIDTLRQADSTAANIASLVFEAKVDVINIPNLMSSLADPAFEADMLSRLRLAAIAKGINGTLILDGEEEYHQKSASFATLPDVLMTFMQLVSGAADIPMTRLLGQSPGGLNASGESDIRNYYDRIRSNQELSIEPAMGVLDEVLIRSALGARPPEVFYNWKSLWQSTEKERADIGKTVAETIASIAGSNLINRDALAEAAANTLTEFGVLSGLESAIDTHSIETEEDDDELLAAATAKAAPTTQIEE